jgi:2-keto-4-pentenoate hydratase/2-oxohepta-3-ene-1,7-dioic acid hydratase in catechol pathway
MVELPVAGNSERYTVNPSKIIALGLNYAEHVRESVTEQAAGRRSELPGEPILFPKTPNTLIGPEETIRVPEILQRYGFEEPRTDYEGELALIIAERCKHVSREEAWSVIYGFTCMNDVSQRNIQKGDRSGWFRGKSFDTFGPIGPQIVPTEAVLAEGSAGERSGEPDDGATLALGIRTRLNGRVVQDGNTRDMIFAVPEIVSFVSRNFTLEPGDIIVTGTPSGVGPLQHGDSVEVEIDGIGTLRNPVIDESYSSSTIS